MPESIFSNGFYSMLFVFVIGFIFYMSRQIKDETSLQMQEASGAISYIIRNLLTQPINDLVMVPTGQDCPEDYTEEPIGNFSGTVEACWNSDTQTYSQLNACTRHSNEVTISEIDFTSLYNWRGFKFCSTRVSEGYFETGNCSHSYKKCGTTLCVDEDEECPVTSVTLGKDSKGRITNMSLDHDQTSDGHLVFLDISINSKPCISDLLWPRSFKANTTLPLIKKVQGCEVSDSDSTELDSMTGLNFFSQFPELKQEVSRVPLLSDSLFSENFILVARNKLSIQNINEMQFCMSISSQDSQALQAPLQDLQKISSNFKWHSFWFLALGIGIALFTVFANHILKYIVGFSATLTLYSCTVLWQLWSISVIKQDFKTGVTFLEQVGSHRCFYNAQLNEFMFTRFSDIWVLSDEQQDAIGTLFWITLALTGLSYGLVYWVWRRREAIKSDVVVYNRASVEAAL